MYVAQQPQLTSIRRDHDELQKKIGKLQQKRDQCVSNNKMSEVCPSRNLFYFEDCLQCFDAVGWAAGRASGL